jgi:hypothetical protein
MLCLVVGLALWRIARMLIGETSLPEALQVAGLASITLLRVIVLIALASVVGADRHLGGPAAARHADRAAGGAVPGGVPGQSAVSGWPCSASSPGSSIPICGSVR